MDNSLYLEIILAKMNGLQDSMYSLYNILVSMTNEMKKEVNILAELKSAIEQSTNNK